MNQEQRERVTIALQDLLNREGVDSAMSTPDFLLADMLVDWLEAYERVVTRTQAWLGLPGRPGLAAKIDEFLGDPASGRAMRRPEKHV